MRMIVAATVLACASIGGAHAGVLERAKETGELRIGYRTGDMWAPNLSTKEALHAEAEHFIDCVRNAKQPVSSAASGLRVVEILEAACLSITAQGKPVRLNHAYRLLESA